VVVARKGSPHNVFHALYLLPYKETVEYGPNFLEPPPNIIDGKLKWEVEAIVNICYYGPKKKKQYHVQWKGYSRAHDTWELEENIHTPELIKQYHRAQGTHIRTAKVSGADSMFSEEHLCPSGDLPIVETPSSLASTHTDPEWAELYARVGAVVAITKATQKLAQIAQDREEKP